jgi:hypothetical protein
MSGDDGYRFTAVSRAILADPDYRPVVTEPRLLGTWLLCAMDADDTWPKPCYPPVLSEPADVDRLVTLGVVTRDGAKLRVPYIQEQRQERREKARKGGKARAEQADEAGARDTVNKYTTQRQPAAAGESPPAAGEEPAAPSGTQPLISSHLISSQRTEHRTLSETKKVVRGTRANRANGEAHDCTWDADPDIADEWHRRFTPDPTEPQQEAMADAVENWPLLTAETIRVAPAGTSRGEVVGLVLGAFHSARDERRAEADKAEGLVAARAAQARSRRQEPDDDWLEAPTL